MADPVDVKSTRRRLLDVRLSMLETKRLQLESLTKELATLTYDEDVSVRQLATSLKSQQEKKCDVVMALSQVKTRGTKQEHLSPQQPAALSGRQEAATLSRIAQLQKRGQWSDKKLTKLSIPAPRCKTHWDYVLEEMTWMSSVFQQEVKGKKIVSRKCAKMVQKHFTDKAMAIKRAEKTHEQNLRRVAASAAREVRNFWGNIEKLFEFRLNAQIDQKRKKALDQHLNLIVDKTEKYSNLLAESMAENSVRTTPVASDTEATHDEDDDYNPNENSDDDEETIARDEDQHEVGEVDMLKEESDMPIEELLKMYYLKEEANSPVTGPKRKRTTAAESTSSSQKETEERMDKDEEVCESDDVSGAEDETETEEDDDGDGIDDDLKGEKEAGQDSDGTQMLVQETSGGEENFQDVIELAAKFQPTGNTLDTTSVKTKVPFLLKHNLREYQHIGLDWLVSMYERNLNGILADEMGLGKTIQTIALMAHLACDRQVWGPHLVIVPTSVMLNWEMEIKKWCPAFKVLTYYGSYKERRLKRIGWTKPNAFHVCITSYKLVIQDHSSFRRKQWHYLVLDEAQHIKNFKSQRWQLLLNFQSVGRLLLTGTPLQNNLMELWSLMHFLMPNVFESHRDFKEWFSNPLTGMVEGSAEYNDGLVKRLHKVLRPFLLRRLKNEVEKQLPKKYEHVLRCPLSKRQRFLYDDFMSRTNTKDTLKSGNLLSVINVLMQLRKVCNHPNLFEPRPTVSPFVWQPVSFNFPARIRQILFKSPIEHLNLSYHALAFLNHEMSLTGYAAFRASALKVPTDPMMDHLTKSISFRPVNCPSGKIRLIVKSTPSPSPDKSERIPMTTILNSGLWQSKRGELLIRTARGAFLPSHPFESSISNTKKVGLGLSSYYETNCSREKVNSLNGNSGSLANGEVDSEEEEDDDDDDEEEGEEGDDARGIFVSKVFDFNENVKERLILAPDAEYEERLSKSRRSSSLRLCETNNFKCEACPLYGAELFEALRISIKAVERCSVDTFDGTPADAKVNQLTMFDLSNICQSQDEVIDRFQSFARRYLVYVPSCVSLPKLHSDGLESNFKSLLEDPSNGNSNFKRAIEKVSTSFTLQLPEIRLIQYDCGKLQIMSSLLRQLKEEGHRVLVFTQMTKVLDVLEAFLSFHGFIYLRLDGSTKVEQRQMLMERFNNNAKYFCFILSTRSGGVGINLTGADTVIFYDSDWNPTMDAQAQDRCHRIGQTRDVHIYRLISERTVEENILKKANQKRLLGDLAIEGGNFTTAFFKKQTIHDLFEVGENTLNSMAEAKDNNALTNSQAFSPSKKVLNVFESAIAAVEDDSDTKALRQANEEAEEDVKEFDEDTMDGDEGMGNLMKQLAPVERYALSFMEYHEQDWRMEQLRAADAELEAQKQEIDASKIDSLTEEIAEGQDGSAKAGRRTRSQIYLSIDSTKHGKATTECRK